MILFSLVVRFPILTKTKKLYDRILLKDFYTNMQLRVLIILLLFININALADPINKEIKIGIIQHFGKSESDKLLIQTSDKEDFLKIKFSKDKYSEDFKNNKSLKEIKQKSLELSISEEKIFNVFGKTPVIAGSYPTFEQAFYWNEILKQKFPKVNWQIIYADPWQIRTEVFNAKGLLKSLNKEAFNASIIERFLSIHKFLTFNDDSDEIKARKIFIYSENNKPIKINNNLYEGTIEIIPDSIGDFSVINQLEVENYLLGVLPYEIGPNAPLSAMETQAIIARTYALANLDRFLPDQYNLCASQHCQVYKGLVDVNKNIKKAVENTKNIILKDQTNQIAQVFYYSSDGGYSADFSDAWMMNKNSKYQYLKGIPSCKKFPKTLDLSKEEDVKYFLTTQDFKKWECNDFISINKRFRWTNIISSEKLIESMKKMKDKYNFTWKNFSEIKNIYVLERSHSGRVLKLAIETNTENILLNLNEIRPVLNGLASTFFIVEKDSKNNFIFKGAGFGHGVGLSQYGAIKLAEKNYSYEQILKEYFPNYHLAY